MDDTRPPAEAPATQLRYSEELITPEQADRYLEQNIGNRTIREPVVATYARELREGRWKLNGETVKFSPTGRLLDGQHRLLAIKSAGTPALCGVFRGVEEEAFATIDRGATRTPGDIFQMYGEKEAHALAAAARALWMHEHGYGLATRNAGLNPSPESLHTLLLQHPDLRVSLQRLQSFRLFPRRLAIVLHYLFSRKDRAMADLFFDALRTGLNLHERQPVYQLRDRLLRAQQINRPIPDAEVVELVVIAWNHERTGRQVKRLQRQRADSSRTMEIF